MQVERFLTPRLVRREHVQADPRDDRRQPSAEVLDRRGIRAAQPDPSLLHSVIRLNERSEHSVRGGA
jgi:hypothetical protein